MTRITNVILKGGIQVDDGVRQARRDELISLQQDVGQEFAESLLGQEVHPVLPSRLCSLLLVTL